MRKQERQVLENAIKTVNSVIERELMQDTVNTIFCMTYLNETVKDLHGYASTQLRFAGMKEKDFDKFCDTIKELQLLMVDKICATLNAKGD